MHPLEAFTAQMDEFVEQKKQEDRLPKTISEVWDCATSIEEHGFIGYEADNLHKELQTSYTKSFQQNKESYRDKQKADRLSIYNTLPPM